MTIELKIPNVGESIQEVQIGRWLKKKGDTVAEDETLAELETDKASMDLPAPASGVLVEIRKQAGEAVSIGEIVAILDEVASGGQTQATTAKPEQSSKDQTSKSPTAPTSAEHDGGGRDVETAVAGEQGRARKDEAIPAPQVEHPLTPRTRTADVITPSARRALRQYGLSADEVPASGNRLRRKDVQRYVESQLSSSAATSQAGEPEAAAAEKRTLEPEQETGTTNQQPAPARLNGGQGEDAGAVAAAAAEPAVDEEAEEIVPMSLIRRRIAQRLVQAQQQAALLTTYNEVDMSAVQQLRREYGEQFLQRHGVKLGYMSFFVKASVEALQHVPQVNAEIRGDNQIVYRHYYHIGVAIGGGKGLVVPTLRHAQRMSLADIEKAIDDFARRARSNKLLPDELQGGTFTISNGGVYGSLLSTPIVNPPQSGVLGMHAIQERPVARDGQVVIRPMMYLALSYDHRLIDGREAVTFLRRIKEVIEQPSRILLQV